jgi:hypothetical protein
MALVLDVSWNSSPAMIDAPMRMNQAPSTKNSEEHDKYFGTFDVGQP